MQWTRILVFHWHNSKLMEGWRLIIYLCNSNLILSISKLVRIECFIDVWYHKSLRCLFQICFKIDFCWTARYGHFSNQYIIHYGEKYNFNSTSFIKICSKKFRKNIVTITPVNPSVRWKNKDKVKNKNSSCLKFVSNLIPHALLPHAEMLKHAVNGA